MNEEILFEEIQGDNKKLSPLFYKIIIGVLITGLVIDILIRKGRPDVFALILLLTLAGFFLIAFLTTIKMVTQIKTDGIYISFSPFQPWFVKYSWEKVQKIYLREYDAVKEYFGWGIKIGPMGKAYIFSGNIGIQIVLTDDTQILISTQQPDEVEKVLNSLKAG